MGLAPAFAVSVDAAPTASVVKQAAIKEVAADPTMRKKMKSLKANSGAKSDKNDLKPPNDVKAMEFLTQHKWPVGLQNALIKSCKKIAIRYIITDDSGSMMTNDGHRIIGLNTPNVKMIQCTRWSELVSTLKFHAELAHAAKAPTQFRFLNNCEPIMVGTDDDLEGNALAAALMIFEDESPAGQTPICQQLSEVIECIREQEEELRSTGRKACVVIASDGESTDGNLVDAMRPLQDLPVWVVVRLCTDEDEVVQYWNNVDSQLELEMDVLDDLMGEAKEVTDANPWINYGDPMQKLREFGASIKEMDLLDESTLSSEQMRVMCSILVATGEAKALPHPDEDWFTFLAALKDRNAATDKIYDPLSKSMQPWINLKEMQKTYGPKQSGSSSCAIS